ncbi:MAG: VCBS repeat-containing protein [Bacteroidales bacterium]|nr:VCBS repeat-containing protein [Bacteroidales bacterium]
MKIFTATSLLLISLQFAANAQQHIFTNVTTQAGISGQTGLGHSVGWCDIDNDGDLDLAFSNQDGSGFWLYRNDGNGFTDITASAGLSGQGANKILWAEVTHDTYTDLILNSYLFENNGNGTFTNITGGSGISGKPYSAADFDKDGYNDLLRLSPDAAILFNNGDNTFTASVIEGTSYWVTTCLDYDLDGWTDIYLGTYGTSANKLYRNLGNSSFEDVTAAANATYNDAAHGLASGDCNNDGFPDLYIGSYGNLSCRLLLNQGDGTFTDATSSSGTAGHNDTRTVSFTDYNNDGRLDIFSSHHDFYTYSNTLLRNNGDGTFTNVAVQMGLSGQFIGDYFGVGWADYNNDGATDLFAAGHIDKYRLFRNDNCPGNYLNINLVGNLSTFNAVGSCVKVYAGGSCITRWVHGGEGRHDFHSFNLEFGLGGNATVDSLIVYWTSGLTDKIYNPAINQHLTITEGVSPLYVSVTASSTTLCQNDTVQLQAIAGGGSGNYSYQWSPTEGLSDPGSADPLAIPDVTTTYTCLVDDGNASVSDSITLTVFPAPGVEILASPGDTVCIYETILLDAGEGFVSYLWQDGSGYQTYMATNSSGPSGGLQEYRVKVTDTNDCKGTDTIQVYFDPCVGVNKSELNLNPKFTFFPNPARGSVTFFMPVTSSVQVVQIVDSSGRVVKSKKVKGEEKAGFALVTSSLAPGVYFVRIKGKPGGVRKLVIL